MKSSFPTLDQIRGVIKDTIQDEGKTIIAAFDKDVKFIEGKINSVDDKVENLKVEMNRRFDQVDKRFDDNDDAHQQILGDIEEIAERKMAKHYQQQHPFATL